MQITFDLGFEKKAIKLLPVLKSLGIETSFANVGPHQIAVPPNGRILLYYAQDIKISPQNSKGASKISQNYHKVLTHFPDTLVIIENYLRFGLQKQDYLQSFLQKAYINQSTPFKGFIPTLNTEDTAYCIKTYSSRIQIEDNPPVLGRVSRGTTYLWQAQENFVEGLLQCGIKKARLLLTHFDSPDAIFRAILHDPDAITAIKGFGKTFIEQNQHLLRDFFPNTLG